MRINLPLNVYVGSGNGWERAGHKNEDLNLIFTSVAHGWFCGDSVLVPVPRLKKLQLLGTDTCWTYLGMMQDAKTFDGTQDCT